MIIKANDKEYEIATCWRKHYSHFGDVELYKTVQIETIDKKVFIALSLECAYGKKSDKISFDSVLKSRYSIATYIDKATETLRRQILLGRKGGRKW